MTTRCLLVVAIGSALSIVSACGGAPPPVADTSGSSADDSWIFGGEDVWIPIVDPLGESLGDASRALAGKRPADAAAALRDGAAFLDAETERVAPEGRPKVRRAAGALTALADKLDKGAPVSVQTLNTEMREAYSVDVDYRWATVDATEWMPMVQLTHDHLEAAREQLAAKRPAEAATELGKAAALLRLEAGRVGGAERKAIEAAWFEVRQLAAKAQVGALTDAARLQPVAAHACQTLAQAHLAGAERFWAEHQAAPSGQLLDLAVKEFERGLIWIGGQADPAARQAAENARRLAAALDAGPTPADSEVATVFDEFSTAVAALDIRPQPGV